LKWIYLIEIQDSYVMFIIWSTHIPDCRSKH